MFPPRVPGAGMPMPQQNMMRSAAPSRNILAKAKRPMVNTRPKLRPKKVGPRVKV